MPGRISRPSAPPPKGRTPRKKAHKRTLDAFAIAEKQNPERGLVRRHRLGEVEGDAPRHKRRRVEDGASDGEGEEEEGQRRRRRKTADADGDGLDIDGGSDSEGREWRMGEVGSGEDSEIDSEEAFGESDEERFGGFAFRGSGSAGGKGRGGRVGRGNKKGTGNGNGNGVGLEGIDLDEGEGEGEDMDEDEEDDFGEDGVDLVTMLDEDEEGVEKQARKGTKDDVDAGSDAEFSRKGDAAEQNRHATGSDDAPSEFSLSDAEEGDPEKLLQLQDLVSSLQADDATERPRERKVDVHESMAPSDFGLTSTKKLTIADLLPSITDPRIKQSLKMLSQTSKSSNRSGIPGKVEAPLPKRQQDRLDRAAAFEMAKQTLSRWVDTVKHNRRAEHLSFPVQDPNDPGPSLRSLSKPSGKPFNELEATIQSILEESGLGKDGQSEEKQIRAQEELAMKTMPLEEVETRRNELRRQRHLLFAEERRAKRIKKIKSKSFRRVHRKERERNAQAEREALSAAGVDFSDEEREQNERRRAEERMGAKHRESKWAKGIKKSGRAAWDEDARSGVTDMARRNEELRRRIEGKDIRDEDDTEISSEELDYGDDEVEEAEDRRLQTQLGKVGISEIGEDTSKSKLGSMKFMQRAEAARKARNDEDVERMRRELAGEESSSEDENAPLPGRRTLAPTGRAQEQSVEALQPRDGLDFGPFSDDEDVADGRTEVQEGEVEIITERPPIKNGTSSRQPARQSKGTEKGNRDATQVENPWLEKDRESAERPDGAMENPWLAGPPKRKGKVSKLSDVVLSIPTPAAVPKPPPPEDLRPTDATAPPNTNGWTTVAPVNGDEQHGSSDSDDEQHRTPFALRNEEFIKRAFAGDDVLASFEEEKRAAAANETEKKTTTALPGWGSWTGPGLSKSERKASARNPHPAAVTTTFTPGIKPEARKDRKLERVIISEKRVKKNVKYLASTLPHPFENRAQYERSLRCPVGPEWVTTQVYLDRTKPRVMVKQGVIAAMERPLV